MPYTMSSNVPQLASLSVSHKGKGGSVAAVNEVIRWQPGGEFVLSIDGLRTLKSLSVDLGIADMAASFRLETTVDGRNWESVPLQPVNGKTRFNGQVSGRKVQKIRLISISAQEQQVYFKRFMFEEE